MRPALPLPEPSKPRRLTISRAACAILDRVRHRVQTKLLPAPVETLGWNGTKLRRIWDSSRKDGAIVAGTKCLKSHLEKAVP